MNEHENPELTVVTPPPFHQSEKPVEQLQEQEQAASPTLAERIAELELDENAATRLTLLAEGIDATALTPEVLSTLARGITHDDDVQNADAEGYLRGRNEKIETVLHPQPQDEEPLTQPVFPRYCRRSIWDD